jgi:hypothetical protein
MTYAKNYIFVISQKRTQTNPIFTLHSLFILRSFSEEGWRRRANPIKPNFGQAIVFARFYSRFRNTQYARRSTRIQNPASSIENPVSSMKRPAPLIFPDVKLQEVDLGREWRSNRGREGRKTKGGVEMKISTQLIVTAFFCCVPALARQYPHQNKACPAAAPAAATNPRCAENSDLFRAAEAEVRTLDPLSRMLLNQFLQGDEPCRYWSVYSAPQAFLWDDRAGRLRREVIDPYFVPDRAALLLDRRFLACLEAIKDDPAQTHVFRSAAASVLRLSDALDVYPAAVCQKPKFESANPAETPVEEVPQAPQAVAAQPGTVLAVAFDDGKSLCMVEGVEKICAAGDTIAEGFGQGVTVTKIESGQVELKKGRHTWVQKVGEEPSAQWQ